MSAKKRGLGRGLDALLGASTAGQSPAAEAGSADAQAANGDEQLLKELPVDLVQRGKYQPRKDIEPESLQELADSIKAQGVMQPIVVRPVSDRKYEIIAGERRWRATQLAGLDVIPAVVRDVSDEAAIAMALIENIQREDLNPIEEAVALQRLQQEFDLTQQEVAEAVGKSRSTVANLLRLMSLQEDVRRLVEHGDLEMGHARALLALDGPDQSQAARQVVGKGLSVRQTEALVRHLQAARTAPPKKETTMDPNIRHLQDDLSQRLGTRVQIQ
ncbi:MAG: ParB/RepB/Spo0J family partition protein, partial [Halioglobus sp.]